MKAMKIIKRNGQEVSFDLTKIENSIRNASAAVDYKDALSEGRVKLIASETAATADAIPEPMRLITNQNHKLMADMDKADFDGFTKLDPTLNQAVTYIHKANELIVQYPQGSYPIRRAYAMVYTTLHLLRKCEELYGRVQVKKMKQEFYKLLRLWFYTGEPQCPGHLYSKKVFLAEDALISAMCEHNRSIDDPAAARRSYRAPRPTDRPRVPRTRAKTGELTQGDVAKDFGCSRQEICKWERNQTVDGPENTSNPYHYYKSLRTDPKKRDAYTMLVNQAKMHRRMIDEAKAKGQRFKFTFVQYQDSLARHNRRMA